MPEMPFTNSRINHIRQALSNWYEIHKRDLPWRDIKDTYKIWISEIILQQTRVNQGHNYYIRFIKRFPDIKSLAEADEQGVLKYWQGLGYYSRARNLHKTAQIILQKYNGSFPTTFKEIISLPGIGEYTASAICSFSYNQPYATVDGNIFRVLSRLFAIDTPIDTTIGKKEFNEIAQQLLDKRNPGLHNQSIMEFGAIYCIPKNPDCINCVLKEFCKAYNLEIAHQLPVKIGKTKVTNRYFNYFFVKQGDYTFLRKRTKKDIWLNLYEFPLLETDKAADLNEILKSEFLVELSGNKNIEIEGPVTSFRHILSHQVINAVFYTINIMTPENTDLENYQKIRLEDLKRFPVSRLTEMFLEKTHI